MTDDWDLHAVVRSCATAAATSSSTSGDIAADVDRLSSFQPRDDDHFLFFPDPFKSRNESAMEDLHDLFKPFFPKFQPQNEPISPFSVFGGLQDISPQQQQLQQQKQAPPKQFVGVSRTTATSTTSTATQTPRSKRRKNQMKRVCQVPAEGLSSDMWSWRKYGQKPIKGSPYPRGYYRCSTSKGCLARKQVERNRSDPAMFIVTYTAEHNHPMPTHRNSLAGSTRQKPATTQTVAAGDTDKPSCSSPVSPESLSPVSPESLSPVTEKIESTEEREDLVEDEDGDLDISDMVVGDDFFEGLEDLTGPVTGDCISDHVPTSLTFPWLANNAATTAAGGG